MFWLPKPAWLSAVSILLPLAGCSSVDIVRTVEAARVCEAWPQINVRKADTLTPATAGTIERANVGREAIGCVYEPQIKATEKAAKPSKPSKPDVGLSKSTANVAAGLLHDSL